MLYQELPIPMKYITAATTNQVSSKLSGGANAYIFRRLFLPEKESLSILPGFGETFHRQRQNECSSWQHIRCCLCKK